MEHKLLGAGFSVRRGGTDDGTCPRYREEAREERPFESELRRRGDAIEHLHRARTGLCGECMTPHPCPTVRIVRGED